jgi:outer membrane protein OmpA-like peptidoglycan-associated protein
MWIDHRPLRVGIFGGVGLDDFQFLGKDQPSPFVSACDAYQSGTGTSPNFGLQADLPLWGDLSNWTIIPRLSYETFRANLQWTEVQPARLPDGSIGSVSFVHELSPIMKAITAAPLLSFHPLTFLNLQAGPELSLLVSQLYQRTTSPTQPGDLINGQRTRVDASGGIPDSRLLSVSLFVSAGFEVPLSSKLRAAPEAGFAFPLNGVTQHFGVNSFRFDLGFQYDLTSRGETVPIYNKVRVPEIVQRANGTPDLAQHPTRRSRLSASIDATALDDKGNESKILTISVQEVRSKSEYPILNYIFFDEAESALPNRYVRYESFEDAMHAFRGSDERRDIPLLALYRETLNIIGDRLRKNPKATITLAGSTSNTGDEIDNLDLARSRAETVKTYLSKIWQIQPTRIKVVARILPEHQSPSGIAVGEAENRRVEILSSDPVILDPISVIRTERVASPPSLRLRPRVETDSGIAELKIAITTADGHEIDSAEGGPNGELKRKTWTLNESVLSALSDSLYIVLHVKDSAGNDVTARNAIPMQVSHFPANKREALERFSLILFGFDQATIGGRNNRILSQIADTLQSLKPSRISIVGYTDEMGDPSHNDELSEDRAMAVKKEVEKVVGKMQWDHAPRILEEGRGSREQLYDNTLPEGRFFSRTVNITLERSQK